MSFRDDPLLTVEQVADVFQVKPPTIRKWIKDGTIVGVKIGRHWRVYESEVTRLATSRHGMPSDG